MLSFINDFQRNNWTIIIIPYHLMLLSRLKSLFKQFDLFWSTEYFRYRDQPQYRTFTGGICSIILIIICIVVFSSSVIGTFSKSTISWQYALTQQTDNQFTVTTSTDTQAKFMFAIGVSGLDLTTGPRLFDFKLTQEVTINGTASSFEYILQPCRRENWAGAGARILKTFDHLNFSRYLCPALNQTFSITGRSTSQSYKFMRVTVSQCNSTTSTCADAGNFTQYLNTHSTFNFNMYFINVLINPSDPSQATYYLQDRNYVPFSNNYSGEVNIYMSDYFVNTDQEILPYEKVRSTKGGMVNAVGQYLPFRKFGPQFASINIKKASVSIGIQRSYKKLDATLSYVGGLFGFLMVFFVFMRVYTQYSYEVQMGDRLYCYDKQDPLRSDKFHFLTFIGYIFFKIVSFFTQVKWSSMQKYDECRSQIQKQFDVCFLMRRIIFLQRALRVLFTDHQHEILHMHSKLTLKQAQELRGYYKLRAKIKGGEDGGEDDDRRESDQSGEMNVTEDLMERNEALPREDTSSGNTEGKGERSSTIRQKKKKQVSSQLQLSEKQRSMMNDSEAMIHPLTSLRNKDSCKINQSSSNIPSAFSSKLKLLHKQSQSGNLISKKIYEGFSTDLLKNILLKIQEDREDVNDKNQVIVNENQDQVEIRISKRMIRPKKPQRSQQIHGQQNQEKVEASNKLGIDLKQHKSQMINSALQIQMQHSTDNKIANDFQYIP